MSRAKREPELFDEQESGRALDRLVAFSDGVFAIAMTLLVLSLTVPNLTGATEKINDASLLVWNLVLLGLRRVLRDPRPHRTRVFRDDPAHLRWRPARQNVSDDYKRQSLARGIIVPVGFALGIPVAFVSPVWAMWTWWLSIVALSWLVRSHYGEAIRHPYGTTT